MTTMNKTNQMHNSFKILKTFIVLYSSTCFGHPCAHHQEPPSLHIQPPVTVCCWIGCTFQLGLSLTFKNFKTVVHLVGLIHCCHRRCTETRTYRNEHSGNFFTS